MAALNDTGISNPGQVLSSGNRDELFMKVFSGEVLTAFSRSSLMMDKHIVRTISHGKSASFPVMGRTNAKYLKPGQSLDDIRTKFEHTERVISIVGGLLTADCLILDIDDAMNHYDARTEYSRQLGEALAYSADCGVINSLANLAKKTSTGFAENIPKNDTLKNPGTGAAFEFVTGLEESQSVDFGKKILEGLVQARAQFSKNYVPVNDRYCLLTPDAYSAVINALMPNSANYLALLNPENGSLNTVCGFKLIEVPHLLNEGVNGEYLLDNQIKTAGLQGIVFHRSAVGTVKLKDLEMERARRTSYKGDEIVASYSMGHGGLRPEAVGLFVKEAQVAV